MLGSETDTVSRPNRTSFSLTKGRIMSGTRTAANV